MKKKSGLGKRPKKLKNMLPLQNKFLFVSLIHAYLGRGITLSPLASYCR